MELLIKQYQNKASKIAIKYDHEYIAAREYELILKKFPSERFEIIFEFVGTYIFLKLVSEQSGGSLLYKDLRYKMDQVKNLQQFYDETKHVEFVHVFSKANKLLIAKPFGGKELITISKISFINAQGSGSF